ncbi:MAG: putative ParB-like (korB) partition protein [Massilia sp.]|nr:putative ParB-like (korB) partition protein [Massilia sp.]
MALDLPILDAEPGDGSWTSERGLAERAPLALIEEDPENPSFEDSPEDFAALVEDVRTHGILQPIVVRRLAAGRFRIRYDARRYRAAAQHGLEDISYVVTEDPRQFDGYAQVSENERRTALQPPELATFISKKLVQGDSEALVASRPGIHPSTLTRLLWLVCDVPPLLLELYHSRRCRTVQYLYRLGKQWALDPRGIEAECASIGEIDGPMITALEAKTRTDRTADRVRLSAAVKRTAGVEVETDSHGAEVPRNAPRGRSVEPTSDLIVSRQRSSSSCSRRARLFATLGGKEVEIDLVNLSSSSGKALLRFTDEFIASEVELGSLILTRLVELP